VSIRWPWQRREAAVFVQCPRHFRRGGSLWRYHRASGAHRRWGPLRTILSVAAPAATGWAVATEEQWWLL